MTVLYQNHRDEWYIYQWFIMVCLRLWCIRITEMSDTFITVIYHGMSLTVLYQNHRDEWYIYHSDLSWYVSDCTVSESPRWVVHLSQWLIMVCLRLCCIRITEMSDIYVYHSDLLWYVSDCTVPVSSCCWSTGSCKCSFHSSVNCLCVIWRKTFRA